MPKRLAGIVPVALQSGRIVGIYSKEVAEVNSLNGMVPTALLFLLVFLVMGFMILWGVSLLDLPG